MHDHPLFNAQLQLENEMRSLGIDRYREMVAAARENGSETRVPTVRRLVGHVHDQVVAGINAFIEKAATTRGPKHAALRYIKAVDDVDVVAHLTIRSVLDSISTRVTLQRAAISLATLVEDEVHFRQFEEQQPEMFKRRHKAVAKSPTARHRRNSMLIPARKEGVSLDEWSPREKVLLGSKLIEIFVETTGMAQISRESLGSGNTPIFLTATPATLEWIEKENATQEWLAPVYLPTIIPPKPWTTPYDGGYWSGRVRRLTLVKTRNRGYLEELAEREMPAVYGALNALQETPWSINQRVLSVMREVWERNLGEVYRSAKGEPVIPSSEERELPERPDWLTREMTSEQMTEDQMAEFNRWKRDCSVVHEVNAKAVSRRLSFTRMLAVAQRMSAFEEIYFPHQLDWRGRVYPVPLYLHPQGNDAQRGLLEFARAVPLTDDDGVRWLAIHGAGLWGVDKVSLDERVQWVLDNQDEILRAADDPLVGTFWVEAEKPWEALAFCFDWAGWVREGYAYESCLPIQMDGTCNGLQNFSAILRDPIGGAAVNLVPADRPQDIYAMVAEVVSRMVEADLTSEERVPKPDGREGPLVRELAAGWHGRVTRKVTKRPVMTLAYGAREFGFKTQVFEDTVAPWKSGDASAFPWEPTHAWDAAAYMGSLIWRAVQEVVVAAAQAMEWLQQAARSASKEGLPVMWTTPTGFLVQQAYRVPNVKRIETTFEKAIIRLSVDMGGEKIDTRKQASGISPNWVHSLDASHMMRTICATQEAGIRSYCMIHDSFGTHAGNAQVMAMCLREEFVRMYSEEDVLAKFRDELLTQVGDADLPPLPQMGTLDLQQVLESPFFFA